MEELCLFLKAIFFEKQQEKYEVNGRTDLKNIQLKEKFHILQRPDKIP